MQGPQGHPHRPYQHPHSLCGAGDPGSSVVGLLASAHGHLPPAMLHPSAPGPDPGHPACRRGPSWPGPRSWGRSRGPGCRSRLSGGRASPRGDHLEKGPCCCCCCCGPWGRGRPGAEASGAGAGEQLQQFGSQLHSLRPWGGQELLNVTWSPVSPSSSPTPTG